MKEGKRIVVAVLPVLREATTSIEPANGAFDNPALRLDDKAFRVVATPDYLGQEVGHDMRDAVGEDRSGIGAVREQLTKEGKLSEQGGQQQHAAIAVLHVGGGDQSVQQQSQLVDQDVASRAGESHPHALLEPYVNLSAHTAPDVQPLTYKSRQWANKRGLARTTRANQSLAPAVRARSRLYLLRPHRTRQASIRRRVRHKADP